MSGEQQEPDLTFNRANAELQMKQEACAEAFWLVKADRWDVDLKTGFIRFTWRDRIATAPVQVIGTFNSKDDTWLWGWDHPSVKEPLGHAARLCREFGERHGLEALTQRKIYASAESAWEFTALGLHLSGATGAYRGPAGATFVFMTFGEVALSKLS